MLPRDSADRSIGGAPLQPRERRPRREESAEPVDAGARRRRARAEVETRVRRGVRDETRDRTREDLAEVVGASGDVAADVVLVVPFEIGGSEDAAREDPLAEARREALDLRFDAIGHVVRAAVRDVAVGPAGLLAVGRARAVEEALLRDEDEGA